MRILSKPKLVQFAEQYSDSSASLWAWYRVTKAADWNTPNDIKQLFNSVDMVKGKFVFNIAQNRYRLIAHINFRRRVVFVLHILTHKEYDEGAWK